MRTYIQRLSAAGWALFILMMALSKAFDYIIREVVVGLHRGSNPKTDDERLKLIEERLKG